MATAFHNFSIDSLPAQDENIAWIRRVPLAIQQSQVADFNTLILESENQFYLGHAFTPDKEDWATVLMSRHQNRAANRDDPHAEVIDARVNKLRDLAQRSNEPFEEKSAAALQQFCHELAADRKPGIFLLANGNLRALWKNQKDEQIGIQFLADGLLQYVILYCGQRAMLKTLGIEEEGSALEQRIHCSHLQRLWFRSHGEG